VSGPARVLLADDHALVRQGVRLILDGQPDLRVVAEAGDGAQVLELLRTHDVDLVVLDVAMPRMTGLQAAAEVARRPHPPKVLLLSMYDDEQYLLAALEVGASGYVVKSVADRDLVAACRAAVQGGPFHYAGARSALVREQLERRERGARTPGPVLTPREQEVVKLIAEGWTSRQIAGALTISAKTVDRHRTNALAKLGMRDRTELTRYAVRTGLIEP